MAKFKNTKTGNVIRVKNKTALALVEKSDRYEAYTADKKNKQTKKPAEGKQPDGTAAE